MATIDDMMTSLADAVRSKAGVTGKLSITAMTNAVNSISVGSGDFDFSGASSDIADYLMVGYKAFDNTGTLVDGEAENYTDQYSYLPVRTVIGWGGGGSYGEIFMTPTVSNTAVVSNESMIYAQVEGLIPSNIKKGVTIGNLTGTYEGITIDNPIYDTAVTKNITASDTYTFSTYSEAMINISPGWYKYGIDVVCRMDNLIASNIKSGVSILGITGTYEGGSSVDLSGVTAEAQYVLSGQKFVNSSGTLVTGTAQDARASYGRMEVTSIDVNMGEINLKPLSALMPNGTAIITPQTTFFCSVSNILMGGTTITPTKSTQTISSKGKLFYGDITINPIPAEYITTTDATATAADIAKDKTAYVNGQKITGTMEASSGDSTVKFGYWTADGKFQEVDLSGDSPVDIGEPVSVDAQMFATGKPTPDYPSSGGGGMEFYECASVTNVDTTTWSGYKMEWREAENATIGIRLEGWDSNFDGEYILLDNNAIGADRVLAYNGDTNSNKFIKFWEGMFWSLVKSNGTSDSPEIQSSISNANASIDDIVQGLNGRGATFTKFEQGESAPSGWYKTDTLTEGLEVKGYHPVVGKIYNQDTTIEVKKAFDGVLIPIPQNGLVFYAPLQTDYVDMVSGTSASVTGGSFTTYNNKDCLYLENSYISWGLNSSLPTQSNPVSIVMLVSPYAGGGQRTYISIGDESLALPLQIENGSVLEWGSGSISSDGKWKSVIVTRDSDFSSKTYINGELTGSGRISFSPSRSFVCIGALSSYGYIQKINAYVSDTAVYNRVLTADEVLEIHNTLMEDVEQ